MTECSRLAAEGALQTALAALACTRWAATKPTRPTRVAAAEFRGLAAPGSRGAEACWPWEATAVLTAVMGLTPTEGLDPRATATPGSSRVTFSTSREASRSQG